MCEPKDDLYHWLPIHDKVMMNWWNTVINYAYVLDSSDAGVEDLNPSTEIVFSL